MTAQSPYLFSLIILLFASLVGGLLARKIKLPIFIGYLLAGLVLSSLGRYLGMSNLSVEGLTEIGITLLMFSLGLQFSFHQDKNIKRIAVKSAILQVFLTILFGISALILIFNFSISRSIIYGFALSLSSTAMIVKYLEEKGQQDSLSGQILSVWLLLQDLLTIPLVCLITLGGLINNGGNLQSLILKLFLGLLLLVVITYIGRKYVLKFTDLITQSVSRELSLIFAICLILSLSYISAAFGLSPALGAFLAGLVLSGAGSHLTVFSEIRPLKDVFLAFFFVSLGIGLNFNHALELLPVTIAIAICFVFIKIVISSLLMVFYQYHFRTVTTVGFALGQVGEFSFLIGSVALTHGLIEKNDYTIISFIALGTMIMTPLLFKLSDEIYNYFLLKVPQKSKFKRRYFTDDKLDQRTFIDMEDHVILVGFGRVGSWVGRALSKNNICYLVIEYDPAIVRQLKLLGIPVVFGDPTDIDTLGFANINRAKLLISAIPDHANQKMIINNCHALNPEIHIMCRSHHTLQTDELLDLGVKQVIHPEFEAALSIIRQVMQYYNFKQDKIDKTLRTFKMYDHS